MYWSSRENCVGKSTLANEINKYIPSVIYSGKDYLRLDKNPSIAEEKFKKILKEETAEKNIIYIITEKTHLKFLSADAFIIVIDQKLDVIKERFRERMRGNLPKPVEVMLERNHGIYDGLLCDLIIESNDYDINKIIQLIKSN